MHQSHRLDLDGVIASAGFASGDRIVVGAWAKGPLGPMNDVMWVKPSGRRLLIAPNEHVGAFVSTLYRFEEVRIEPVALSWNGIAFDVTTSSISMSLRVGRGVPIPLGRLRPRWFTRYVEGPVARLTMSVNTYGTTVGGVREWYCADRYRQVHSGHATIEDVDAGALTSLCPALNVGFSEPPARPSIVSVRPSLEDCSGSLAGLF